MVLPVIGLLGMTAEWTQRTALTTFTLSPRRGRVLAAKFLGSLVVVTATFVVVILLVVAGVFVAALISGQAPTFGKFGEACTARRSRPFCR